MNYGGLEDGATESRTWLAAVLRGKIMPLSKDDAWLVRRELMGDDAPRTSLSVVTRFTSFWRPTQCFLQELVNSLELWFRFLAASSVSFRLADKLECSLAVDCENL